jgi:hypothetical protein
MLAREDRLWVEHSLLFRYFREVEVDINLHKWFQSEKEGRDIGWDSALVDWTIRVSKRFFQEHPLP